MRHLATALSCLALLAGCGEGKDAAPPRPPVHLAILATIGDSSSTIEGIAEHGGLLYVCDWKDGTIYRIDPRAPTPAPVGGLPVAPGTIVLGIEADSAGNLYFAAPESGTVYRVAADRLGAADFDRAKDATPYATGAGGANAMAFDAAGRLWISGGPTGNLYQVGPEGGAATVAASGYAALSPDSTVPVRIYLANGLDLDRDGAVYTLNTGTGEVTRLVIGEGLQADSITTFARDPRLVGADGLLIDDAGNTWVTANYRNTLARLDRSGNVTIVASSSPTGTLADSTMAAGFPQTGETNVLRFPAEFVLLRDTVYVANLNFPVGANAGQPVRGATVAAVALH